MKTKTASRFPPPYPISGGSLPIPFQPGQQAPEIVAAKRNAIPTQAQQAPQNVRIDIPPKFGEISFGPDLSFAYAPAPHSGERSDVARIAYEIGGRGYVMEIKISVRDAGSTIALSGGVGRAPEIGQNQLRS